MSTNRFTKRAIGITVALCFAFPVFAQTDNQDGLTKYPESHASDAVWCKNPAVARWITTTLNSQLDASFGYFLNNPGPSDSGMQSMYSMINGQKVSEITQITAGVSYCITNDPSACTFTSQDHVCHAVLKLQDGERAHGTFSLNPATNLIYFVSDSTRNAQGF